MDKPENRTSKAEFRRPRDDAAVREERPSGPGGMKYPFERFLPFLMTPRHDAAA